MKRSLFSDGQAVQVGFLDPANSDYIAIGDGTTTYTAETIVLVTPTAGGVWINFTADATAATDGSHYIEFAQDFAVSVGDTINTTGPICVTPYKIT